MGHALGDKHNSRNSPVCRLGLLFPHKRQGDIGHMPFRGFGRHVYRCIMLLSDESEDREWHPRSHFFIPQQDHSLGKDKEGGSLSSNDEFRPLLRQRRFLRVVGMVPQSRIGALHGLRQRTRPCIPRGIGRREKIHHLLQRPHCDVRCNKQQTLICLLLEFASKTTNFAPFCHAHCLQQPKKETEFCD